MDPNNAMYHDDNIISLTDLFNAWRKKKKLFWIIFSCSIAIAVVYTCFFYQQKFTVTQIIQPAGYINPPQIAINSEADKTQSKLESNSASEIIYTKPEWVPLQPNTQLITYLSNLNSSANFQITISDRKSLNEPINKGSTNNSYLILQAKRIHKQEVSQALQAFQTIFAGLVKLQTPYYQTTKKQTKELLTYLQKKEKELLTYHAYLTASLKKQGSAVLVDNHKINDQPVKALLSDKLINDITKLPTEKVFRQINFLESQLDTFSLPKVLVNSHVQKVGLPMMQLLALMILIGFILSMAITLTAAFISNVK